MILKCKNGLSKWEYFLTLQVTTYLNDMNPEVDLVSTFFVISKTSCKITIILIELMCLPNSHAL